MVTMTTPLALWGAVGLGEGFSGLILEGSSIVERAGSLICPLAVSIKLMAVYLVAVGRASSGSRFSTRVRGEGDTFDVDPGATSVSGRNMRLWLKRRQCERARKTSRWR